MRRPTDSLRRFLRRGRSTTTECERISFSRPTTVKRFSAWTIFAQYSYSILPTRRLKSRNVFAWKGSNSGSTRPSKRRQARLGSNRSKNSDGTFNPNAHKTALVNVNALLRGCLLLAQGCRQRYHLGAAAIRE